MDENSVNVYLYSVIEMWFYITNQNALLVVCPLQVPD